jgi:uncharacterized protein YegJ (DUF2314 family)
MKTLLVILSLISTVSFGQNHKIERQSEPDIYNVYSDDKEMNEAIKLSRLTFDTFLKTFKKPKRNQTHFSIKVSFPTKQGAEHIWLVNIESKDGKLFGQIDNLPEYLTSVKLGDKIEINRNKISDWFYTEYNKLIGGQTIRVLRNRMTPAEKRQFDKEFGVKF